MLTLSGHDYPRASLRGHTLVRTLVVLAGLMLAACSTDPTATPLPTPTPAAVPRTVNPGPPPAPTPTAAPEPCGLDVPYDVTMAGSGTDATGRTAQDALSVQYSGDARSTTLQVIAEGVTVFRQEDILLDGFRYGRYQHEYMDDYSPWDFQPAGEPDGKWYGVPELLCLDPSGLDHDSGSPHYSTVEETSRADYWFDPSGRLTRLLLMREQDDDGKVLRSFDYVYSGLGEPNDIQPPDLSHHGLVATRGEGIACGNLDRASYYSSGLGVSADSAQLFDTKHSGSDAHTVVRIISNTEGKIAEYEMLLKDETRYYRETYDEGGEINPLYQEWSIVGEGLQGPQLHCLDTSKYDHEAEDPHSTRRSSDLLNDPYIESLTTDLWGDEYGRPVREVQTFVYKDMSEGTITVDYTDYGAEYVMETPDVPQPRP
ncbi:MAG: hypothetical protein OXE50_12825 [Chloroflexi bacterium]|nr:hypothetical protein [Chloroflexota bacterium]